MVARIRVLRCTCSMQARFLQSQRSSKVWSFEAPKLYSLHWPQDATAFFKSVVKTIQALFGMPWNIERVSLNGVLELKFLDFLAMILFLLPHRDKVTFERGEFQNTCRAIDPAGIGSRDRVFGPVPGQPERGVCHRVPSNNCRGWSVYRWSASGGWFDFSAGQFA